MNAPVLVESPQADAAALSRIHGRAFARAWSADFIASLLASPGAMLFVAPAEGEAQGFILARTAADECEILTLAVSPAARRRGLGSALVRSAAAQAGMQGAKAMFLEVETTNAPARSLYEQLGFQTVGERRGYYRDAPGKPARDALTLKAELPLRPLGKSGGFG